MTASDEPDRSGNHDGSTQPLPINGEPPTDPNSADTVPFDHVPIAEPATLPAAVAPAVATMPSARRTWAPWLVTALLALVILAGAAALIPPLLAPAAVESPSPSPTAPTAISPSPVDSGAPAPAPAPVETVAPPPPPQPTPLPTINPPDPTPAPTG